MDSILQPRDNVLKIEKQQMRHVPKVHAPPPLSPEMMLVHTFEKLLSILTFRTAKKKTKKKLNVAFFFLFFLSSIWEILTSWLGDYQQWQHTALSNSTVAASSQKYSNGKPWDSHSASLSRNNCLWPTVKIPTEKHQSGTWKGAAIQKWISVWMLRCCHNQKWCADTPSLIMG